MEPLVESTPEAPAPPPEPVEALAKPAVRCAWRSVVRAGDNSIQFMGAPSISATVQRGVIGEDFLWGIKTIGAPACLQRVRRHYDVAVLPRDKRRVVIVGGNKILELLFQKDPPKPLVMALEDVFSRHVLPGTKLAQLQAKVALLNTPGARQGRRGIAPEVRAEAWRQRQEGTMLKRREKALRRATKLDRVAQKYL